VDTIVAWCGSVAAGLVLTAVAIAIAQVATAPRVAVNIRRIESVLETRSMSVATGVACAAIVWWCWGSIRQVPFAQDERAYLLQASIFATRHWTAQSPPLPQFFDQMHVLVAPTVAAKYPPGHSLILAIGAWLGLPGLGPLVLSAIAGMLVFVVSRRLAGPWVALLTWFIWVTEGANIRWRASYFSETSTAALWLLGWWTLLAWRKHHRWWAMACLGGCVGWGAMTRPLTMFVFAIPVAAVVVVDVCRRRAWSDLVPGIVAGSVCLAVVPIWSAHTTGDWRVTPLTQYTRDYIPWDHPGLGFDSVSPKRPLPADLQMVARGFIDMHRSYTASAVAPALAMRVVSVTSDFAAGWRSVFAVFFILGLLDLTTDVVVGLATAGLLFLAYLSYAHPPYWTLYYLEMLPVLAFLAARGMWKCVNRGSLTRAGVAVVLLVAAGASFAVSGLRAARESRAKTMSYAQRFDRQLGTLPAGNVLVFVRYGPHHMPDYSLVGNVPDPERARAWIAYDRGVENRQLIDLAPGRSAYLYDETTRTFSLLAERTSGPHAP